MRVDTAPAAGLRTELSEAQEDYLKQIFLLGEGEARVSTQTLAERLRVRPASVSGMITRLSELGLVEHTPYRGVGLTAAGRRVALEMLRHHRLLEAFLVRELGYHWDEVHDEAERLEHVISERFEARIAEAMGHPTHDPHGDPIPCRDLRMPHGIRTAPPDAFPAGARATLLRVGAQDPASLATLERLGLTPGALVVVLEPGADPVRLEVAGAAVELPAVLARSLCLEGPG
jgi:DtxR family Mn-dependent transcriptional regulator